MIPAYEDMPGLYKDILFLAQRLHYAMVPHELSMTQHNGWCIEIYPIGCTPFDTRKFILIQDDNSKKDKAHGIEFITEDDNKYDTEILDEDECFNRIERWWRNEYETKKL